jgi:hypothetical protein
MTDRGGGGGGAGLYVYNCGNKKFLGLGGLNINNGGPNVV